MRTSVQIALAASLLSTAATVWAQHPGVYPGKGQSAQQQATDDSQCLSWARQNTGIDPAVVAATPVTSTGPQGERVRGAARGAVGGAVIGEIAHGDAGKGAGVGATVGVLAGGARSRRNQAAQMQQGQAQKSQQLDAYYRAYGACMQGRGYTVK